MGLFNRFRRRVKETVDASDAEGMLADEGSEKPKRPSGNVKPSKRNPRPPFRLKPQRQVGTIGRILKTTRSRRLTTVGMNPRTTGNCPRRRRRPRQHRSLVAKHQWPRRLNFA